MFRNMSNLDRAVRCGRDVPDLPALGLSTCRVPAKGLA